MTDSSAISREELLAHAGAIAVSRENLQDLMDRYIEGEATNSEIVALFQFLIDTGLAWQQHPVIQDAARYIMQTDLITKPEDSL